MGSVAECRLAVGKLMRKTKLEIKKDVMSFLIYAQPRFVIATNAFEYAMESSRPYKELVNNMAVNINKILI